MIQRIQTVWWLASAILLALFCFLPIFETNGFKVSFLETGIAQFPSITTVAITILVSVVNVFLFKNRKIQLQLGLLLLLLHLGIFILIAIFYSALKGEGIISIQPWIFLPVLSFFFQLLALRGVRKDEALVKSMDRLR